jgi:hypothetical protein
MAAEKPQPETEETILARVNAASAHLASRSKKKQPAILAHTRKKP